MTALNWQRLLNGNWRATHPKWSSVELRVMLTNKSEWKPWEAQAEYPGVLLKLWEHADEADAAQRCQEVADEDEADSRDLDSVVRDMLKYARQFPEEAGK